MKLILEMTAEEALITTSNGTLEAILRPFRGEAKTETVSKPEPVWTPAPNAPAFEEPVAPPPQPVVQPIPQPQPQPAAQQMSFTQAIPTTNAPAQPQPQPAPAAPTQERSYTPDEVSRAAVGLMDASGDGQEKLRTLLKQFGVNSLPELFQDPSKIGQFVVALRGMGAAI